MVSDELVKFHSLRTRRPVPRSWQLRRLLWSFVQATLFRCSFHTFNGWRAILLRLFGAKIGPKCTIRRTSRVYYPWNLTMGEVSGLGDNAEVYNLAPMRIGNRVLISQEAYLCGGTHDYRESAMPLVASPIEIGDDAWVCARAFVGPGVRIGAGAIVGAASVVVKDVPEWVIVAGNPARLVKERERLTQ